MNLTNAVRKILLTGAVCLAPVSALAHPHVFVEANIEVLRNAEGAFTEVRHVWRFDELFSATILIDYDENGDGKLDEAELKQVTDTVKSSIAEYDFYTAVRAGEKALEFYEPEALNAYYEDGRMIMFLALELDKPLPSSQSSIRVSASDSSYYVAFDFDQKSVSVSGETKGCSVKVEHPDYDKLYADNSPTLTESFFNDPQATNTFGDEFYSWATVTCS